MSLYIASLNSGSNGNCYYIGNNEEAILIDAGISCRETEKRMQRLGLLMNRVKAVFVSHEHTDHITGIKTLCHKYHLPVYITEKTLLHSGLRIAPHLPVSFAANTPVTVGGLTVHAFAKFHDAHDPHSFIVESNGIKIGIFTDIGHACEKVIYHFGQCHAAFLEANYDEEMLATGNYPYHLKRRISGGQGHLSNSAALQLFTSHRASFLSHLILSHLSKNNNRPELVEQLFHPHAGATKIVVASRYAETPVFVVQPSFENTIPVNTAPLNIHVKIKPRQLALFE